MIFSIPIFIEERSSEAARPPTFIARPLFRSEPVQRAEKLSRVLTKLSNELHQLLHDLGREPRHDALAHWTFNPLIEETTLDLRLELASGSHRRSFFLAGYPVLERKLFLTPALPELQFELLPGQSLVDRATAVLTRHLREIERDEGSVDLDEYALIGKARLTTIDLTIHPATLAKKPQKPTRAFLFGSLEEKDGEQELRKVGRPLHSMYPDDLDRAVGREREVEELARLLAASDRRPILLVGPRKVGKTTILHELAWQMGARKKERFGGGREIWLVSPMRLISGMSYLGEWENRVLAILDHVHMKDRVLFFDDLLGLFTAGVSCASDLNVAQLLKPKLEKRSFRLIAEITPEAWRVLRERDRAFSDLFHVIPVNEPPEPETLRVLVDIARQLEEAHHCEFDLEIVPTTYEVHRRFVSDAAFPGKAAAFLRRLAVRFSGGHVLRQQALEEFHLQSGLHIALLNDSAVLDRKEIVDHLRRGVVGQDHALQAFADILVTLKARLNDPKRPLGTLLLLGPTGVGKTQAARTLANYLFGQSERLLRFDMNEYVDGASASRLTGTQREPEGLLTSAVRRQPFSVVLFDEIEKAAPEVFDLLLALLDEGRLTDSLGRVTDFTQTVILLTSNLGVREAQSRLGFGAAAPAAEADDPIYLGAVEKFFRPEFFNRLDRIIPFHSLDREQLEGIARQLLAMVMKRDGLQRRNGLLSVTPPAMARLVEMGHHPQLGARALKRVIEREVAQPIAEKLAALPPGTPMIANFSLEQDKFFMVFRDLRPVAQSVFWGEATAKPRAGKIQSTWTTNLLEGAYAALDRIEAELESNSPEGKIELGKISPEHAHYFFCREHLKKVDRLVGVVERAQESLRRPQAAGKFPRPNPVKVLVRQLISCNPRIDRQGEAIALRHDLDDFESDSIEVPDSPLITVLRELALLETLAARPVDHRDALLVFRACLAADTAAMFRLARSYADCLSHICGPSTYAFSEHQDEEELLLKSIFEEKTERTQAIYLKGPNVRRLFPGQANTILTRRGDGNMGLILMTIEPADSEAEARARARKLDDGIDTLNPDSFGPVIQMIAERKAVTDFRTGLVIPARPSPEEFRALLLSALPLPPEVDAAIKHHH